jgi:hypothetical protein
MSLIENKTKLIISDWKRSLLHLCDLEGTILKSFNPDYNFKKPTGDSFLKSDSNDEKIFVGDSELHKMFACNSNFDLKFQFGDKNLKYSRYKRIDNEFDKTRLYVSNCCNDKITIWDANTGTFINKIEVFLLCKLISL